MTEVPSSKADQSLGFSESKAPSNAPSSINPILKSNQASRVNQSRVTVPMTPISEPVSQHSNIFQSTQNMRPYSSQPSSMPQSANRSPFSSRPQSAHTSNEDVQWCVLESLSLVREYRVTERSNSNQVARQPEHRSFYFVIYIHWPRYLVISQKSQV